MRLLVVEDELELLKSLGQGLELDGYYVDLASTGQGAMEFINTEKYDLVILDLNLPDIFGIDLLQQIMEHDKDIKVIILTARSELEMKIQGLYLGASDYLVKPFHFEELEARIRVLLRRNYVKEDAVLVFGDLKFDTLKRELYGGDQLIPLTKKEMAIIEYLMKNQDKLVSAEDFLAHAWDSEADYFSNSVRVHITTLRKKIKAVLNYNPIGNKVGEGYYLKKDNKSK